MVHGLADIRDLFKYLLRSLIVRFHEDSKPGDLHLKLFDLSEIWQAHRQHRCRRPCQIAKLCDDSNDQSHGSGTLQDLSIRRLIGYWNGTHQIADKKANVLRARFPVETAWARVEISYIGNSYSVVSIETTCTPVEIPLWLCDGIYKRKLFSFCCVRYMRPHGNKYPRVLWEIE